MPLKLLHIISTLDPTHGGPAQTVYRMVLRYEAASIDVAVVTLDDPARAPWLKRLPSHYVHALGPALGDFGYSRRLREWLRDHAADYSAIIVHGLWQYQGIAVRDMALANAVPYFVFTHGMLDPWFNRRHPLKRAKKIIFWLLYQYRILRDARGVFFTTPTEMELAAQAFSPYRARALMIGYGAEPPHGDIGSKQAAFLAKFPELTDKRFLLFLGRIDRKKGCDILVEGFAEFAKTHELHLVMAGPDATNWADELRALARARGVEHHVHWTGMLTGEVKGGALACAEAFILPSHQENFGVAVAEALSFGTPVLISNKVNIWPDIIKDSAGLVADDDIAGVRALLKNWLALPLSRRAAMREAARSCFARRFDDESFFKRFVQRIATECTTVTAPNS